MLFAAVLLCCMRETSAFWVPSEQQWKNHNHVCTARTRTKQSQHAVDHHTLFRDNSRSWVPKRDSVRLGFSESDDSEESIDFPAWVSSLRQWPLYPSTSSQSTEIEMMKNALKDVQDDDDKEEEEGEDDEETTLKSSDVDYNDALRAGLNGPLASLINVEALLVANGEGSADEVLELEKFLKSEEDEFPASYVFARDSQDRGVDSKPLSILANLRELGGLDKWLGTMVSDLDAATSSSTRSISNAADSILKQATSRLDYIVSEASAALSPTLLRGLVERAANALALSDGDGLVAAAERLVRDQGVGEAAQLVTLLNNVLVAGFAKEFDESAAKDTDLDEPAPLFSSFASAQLLPPNEFQTGIGKAAEMGMLSAATYENMLEKVHGQNHALVANGTTADVVWMVSDSIDYASNFDHGDKTLSTEPIFVRTITVRGFDASDENVDREKLLNTVCTATPELLQNGVAVHCGLLGIARELYRDVMHYVDTTSPRHKIILNGHSVGGSLSVIMLLLMAEDRGGKHTVLDFLERKTEIGFSLFLQLIS